MIARTLLGLGFSLALLSAPAAAQVVEDFEHGNENLYSFYLTQVDNFDITASSAHDGALGGTILPITNPAFRVRTDVTTSPGTTYEWYVRNRGALTGRSYVGVGASAAGTWSGVFAPNTSQIMLQNNMGWAFSTAGTASFFPVADTWYLMRLQWDLNGDMTLSVLDEAGTNTLSTLGPIATGFTTSGGISIRGFGTNATTFHDVDTIREPGGGGIPPVNYCTAKTTSNGCVPAIAFSGTPSAGGNYVVSCSQVEVGQLGVLFYGTNGPTAITFQGGFLCVAPPVIRLPFQNSGGAAVCSGSYSVGLSALIGTMPLGQMVNCQYWFRDPGAASGTGLSNANEFVTQ